MTEVNYSLFRQFDKPKLSKNQFLLFKDHISGLINDNKINTQPVVNVSTTVRIFFKKRGIKHGLMYNATLNKLKSWTVIREMVRKATCYEIASDKVNNKLAVLKLYTTVKIDSELFLVRIIIKQNPNGKHYYHHDLLRFVKKLGVSKN